jgi:hypothetical protein
MRLALLGSAALAGALAASPAASEVEWRHREGDARCHEGGDRHRATFCEVREASFSPAGALRVDASPNGGIQVHGGGQGGEVKVLARVTAVADDPAAARALAKAVRIETGAALRTVGPRSTERSYYHVSYEVTVPDGLDLDLETVNGGIRLANIEAKVDLRTQNGGVSIEGASGQVRGRTTNGGITARLDGTTWAGESLDLETTNGGITLSVPEDYNARLETGTINGGLNFDFPVTLQGQVNRKRLALDLGAGGPLVRVVTTNGGVTVKRR